MLRVGEGDNAMVSGPTPVKIQTSSLQSGGALVDGSGL